MDKWILKNKLTLLIGFAVFFTGAITVQQVVTGNYCNSLICTENLVLNPTPYKTNTGVTNATGMTMTRATATAAYRFQNQAYWSVQSSTQGACATITKSAAYGPLLNGSCMAGLMFNGDANGYSIRVENSTGGILSETPLDNVMGYTQAYTSGFACADSSERVVKICRTATGTGATIGVGELFYGKHSVSLAPVVTEWKNYTPVITTGSGTLTNYTVTSKWMRFGPNIRIVGKISFSAAPGGTWDTIFIAPPTGVIFDLTNSDRLAMGSGTKATTLSGVNANISTIVASNGLMSPVFSITAPGATPVKVGSANFNNSSAIGTGDYIPFNIDYPVSGWDAGAQVTDQYGGQVIGATAQNTTTQSIAVTTAVKVNLNSAPADTANMVDTVNSRIYARGSGLYNIKALIIADGATLTSGVAVVGDVRKNGSVSIINDARPFSPGAQHYMPFGKDNIYLNDGEFIELYVSSTDGSYSMIPGNFISLQKVSPQNYTIPFKKAPTVTRLTSGSGTYTVPQGVLYLIVEMVGGGAGGSGSSTTAANNGGTGGNGGATTFGDSLLTAGGGQGSSTYSGNGAGGSVSTNAPAIVIASIGGASGQAGAYNNAQVQPVLFGPVGASSPFGGAGSQVSPTSAGKNANANTGSGGGGAAGTNAAGGSVTGSGGAAGGYLRAMIPNPSTSYPYTVGSGGVAGAAGTSGSAGGAGGAGVIIITEHYN